MGTAGFMSGNWIELHKIKMIARDLQALKFRIDTNEKLSLGERRLLLSHVKEIENIIDEAVSNGGNPLKFMGGK
jgi:hypothetical protein